MGTETADGIFNAGLDEVKYWVLRWGRDATVFAPEALRLAVLDEAHQMAKQSA